MEMPSKCNIPFVRYKLHFTILSCIFLYAHSPATVLKDIWECTPVEYYDLRQILKDFDRIGLVHGQIIHSGNCRRKGTLQHSFVSVSLEIGPEGGCALAESLKQNTTFTPAES